MIRFWLTALLVGTFFFVSCSKDDDDKLDGKWQLRQMEVDGQTIQVDTVFYNFQSSLFMYQIVNPATEGVSHCYGFKEWEGESTLQLELTGLPSGFLSSTDWTEAKESFTVEKLTGNKLILNRENKRYIFRKF